MMNRKFRINPMMGYGFFPDDKITINATVYDADGNLAHGVIAWPEGRYEDRAGILSDGLLYMDNVDKDSNIIFSYFDDIIHEVPARDIGTSIVVHKEVALNTVYLNNDKEEPEKDNSLLYLGFGILGLFVVSQIMNAE